MNRNKFLRNIALATASLALLPSVLGSAENKDRIQLDAYVHSIEGDRLSTSFRQKNHGLWTLVYDKVKEFYGNHFDISVNIEKVPHVKKEQLSRNRIAVEYTTLDDALKNPRDILEAFGGKELMDELELEIKRAQKAEGWEYKRAESEIFKTIQGGVRKELSAEGGLGTPIGHRAWIFPSPTVYNVIKNDTDLTHAYAHFVAHEVGHALGLAHPQGRGMFSQYGARNIMNPQPDPREVLNFNLDIHPHQVDQIKEYLQGKN